MQTNWLHVCAAIDCNNNHIEVVMNGKQVVEMQFLKQEGLSCPTNLSGKLFLQKASLNAGYWYQSTGRVTNVNIFHGLMSAEDMRKRTAGEDCGEQDGDYLSWAKAVWSLKGAARWTEVSVDELCRKYSDIQMFTTQGVHTPENCKQLCKKLHVKSRMASVETPNMYEKFLARAKDISRLVSPFPNFWLPVVGVSYK